MDDSRAEPTTRFVSAGTGSLDDCPAGSQRLQRQKGLLAFHRLSLTTDCLGGRPGNPCSFKRDYSLYAAVTAPTSSLTPGPWVLLMVMPCMYTPLAVAGFIFMMVSRSVL